jgi:uncharacterized protein (TIRG00374 family)
MGGLGFLVGGVFLWFAMRNLDLAEVEITLRRVEVGWLLAGVFIYLTSISLRCLRWGFLLRATGSVKWRHAAEALVAGYAANFVLPGRVGEIFRADYARRVFKMSRFTLLGTIVIERVCDGLVLVCVLWLSLAWIVSERFVFIAKSWIFLVGAIASALFGLALIFILFSKRIDLRRLGVREGIAARWDQLVEGVTSITRGNTMTVILCSIGVAALDALTLGIMARGFGIGLSPAETLMLLALAALSTLLPTAPGFLGTLQLVFGQVFQIFGYPEAIGIVTATAVQIFCFGTVTIIGAFVLLSRSGITIWRTARHQRL